MGVYHFIQGLIVEGIDAWFVKDKEPGRFAINWLKATERYANDYKPGNKNKKSRNPSNNLWSALLYKRYKDDGAKEYKESQKKDEGGNIVERQFQLPAKIFESLFGSDDGRQEDTGGTSSKVCKSSQETANASTSDTSGYEDTIDTSCDDTDSKSEEESDISTPFEVFGIPKEELKKLSYDQGVVEGIFPKAGSTEGGLLFIITFKEQLPEDDTSEMYEAEFDGVGVVPLEKFENSALSGFTPSSSKTGLVKVTVRTQAGRLLLVTSFLYVDRSTLDVLKQLVKDPALQSLLFAVWSQEQSICGSNSVDALSQGPSTMQDQGSSIKTEHAQALKVLQLLALTAGQTNARQFIQMLFRTSFGKTMPDANKVPTPLLKDVSMASSHDDIAQNLQDVNTRLTKEGSSEVPVTAANDIQKQSSVTDDETSLESGQCKRARDDNQGDYFADIETSSSGSFELEAGGSDSDDDDGSSSGPASKRRRISWSLQEEEYPLTGRKKGKGFKRPILRRGIVSEPSATVVADVNKALIKSNSGGDKNETALMMMSPSVNWAEFLTPAPMTIGLLGHLLLIAGEKDFSLENQRPEKGFQFIEHPESFRACLVQVSNTGWRAFNEAHKNMDAIRLYSAQVPDQVKKVVHTLIKGSDEDVKDFLPIELGKIERNSTECLRLAQSVEAKFELMMDLTRELLEVSSAARGYYEKKQEEVKLKREIALAKEKLAREKIYAAKEQQEKMEKGVRDAKRSWERVIDSLPSGCDILGMEIAETIVHGFVEMVQVAKDAIASVARSAAQAGGPGQRAGVEQSSTGGQPVPTFKGAEELKIYTSQLSEVLSSASKRTKDDADPKAEEPIGKKLQKMKIFMQELRKDLTGKEESSIDPEMQELLENGLEICKEGEKIANGLTFSPDKLKGIAAKAAELQKKVMKFCIKARAKTGGNPFTTKAPRQAQTMTSSVGSTSKSAAKTAVESAQFKIAESRGLLERQENRYDQTCKDLEASNEELSKVLESLAELSPEKLADFDQIRDTLMRGIKALAEVREQWQKLVQFFQFITNIIKVCQNESLKSFVDYTKVGQKRVLANGYASSDFMRDLIYEQVSQANTTSYVVWSISNTYVEISSKYLMGRLANLGQLIALDPAKERHTIELKKTELMESSKEAQEAIRTLVEKAKDDFHAKVEKRIKQIENELLKVLPAEDPAKIKEIKDTVSLAIKEADNRFNEDDF